MSDRLRITFVLPTLDLSGGVRVIAAFAQELHRRGHRVLVVAGRPRPALRDRLRAAIRGGHRWWSDPDRHHFAGLGVPVSRLPARRPITEADLPEADVVVATWWETAERVAVLSPSRGAKAYYVQHHEIHMAGQPVDRVNATYRLPLHLFACSRWVRDEVAPHAGRLLPIVGYGTDHAIFNAPPRGKQSRPTVGFMYSDARFKGIDTTLSAIQYARAAVPDLQVVAFGSCPPTVLQPLPSGAHFEQSPPQARIAQLYGACDAWLMGSRAEGYGLPILEAMACRTPVIATRTGAAEDLVEENVNGHIVDVEDAAAMGDRIAHIATLDPKAWQSMSDAARATAARHTWPAATDVLLRELRTAIALQRDGAP